MPAKEVDSATDRNQSKNSNMFLGSEHKYGNYTANDDSQLESRLDDDFSAAKVRENIILQNDKHFRVDRRGLFATGGAIYANLSSKQSQAHRNSARDEPADATSRSRYRQLLELHANIHKPPVHGKSQLNS